jgi:bifunctional DNA-binding transcriptional regulator/antitoxin component of YhaV-PrlF toxin-antitoxin module
MRPTERGQVTIPKTLREKYGITKYTELQFLEREEGLLLVKAGSVNPLERFRGLAKTGKGIPTKTDDFIRFIRETAENDSGR